MSYVIIKCLKSIPEYFRGLDIITGTPRWTDDVEHAQLWESRLHAEAQAMLLIRHGELGIQQKPVHVFTAVLGEELQ